MNDATNEPIPYLIGTDMGYEGKPIGWVRGYSHDMLEIAICDYETNSTGWWRLSDVYEIHKHSWIGGFCECGSAQVFN